MSSPCYQGTCTDLGYYQDGYNATLGDTYYCNCTEPINTFPGSSLPCDSMLYPKTVSSSYNHWGDI